MGKNYKSIWGFTRVLRVYKGIKGLQGYRYLHGVCMIPIACSMILNLLTATHEDVAKKLLQFNVILNLIQLCYSQDILISSQTHEAPRTKAWECSSWRTEKWLHVWEKTGQPWLHSHSTLLFNIIGYQSLSGTYQKWSRVQWRVRGHWPTTPTLTLKYPYP